MLNLLEPKRLTRKFFCLVAMALAISSCGGGSGGSSAAQSSTGVTTPPAMVLSVTPSAISITATQADAAASGSVQIAATNSTAVGYFASESHTVNAISSVSIPATGAQRTVTINFKSPVTLAPGSYVDTLTLKACSDQQCSSQINNSPQQVQVTLTVSAISAPSAAPAVAQISPSSVAAGSSGLTLVLSGSGFNASSVALWNGAACQTIFVSSSVLEATIPASATNAVSIANVAVSNVATAGGISSPVLFPVTPSAPALNAVVPSGVTAGGPAFTLTLNGAGFDVHAQATWNGAVLQTTYISPTQISAQIPASDIINPATAQIGALNADSPGLASTTLPLAISGAQLALTSVAPVFAIANGPAFTETVFGSGFDMGSTVQWNGSARLTTYVSANELKAQITSADIASPGTSKITVVNSTYSTGTTAAIGLNVISALPAIDAVALQLNPQHTGAVNFATTVSASAFPLSPIWTATLDGSPSYALISGGRVFVAVRVIKKVTSGYALSFELAAFNATTGEPVWGPVVVPGANGAPTYENGKIFTLSNDWISNAGGGYLNAYDAATGSLLWSTIIDPSLGSGSYTAPPTALNGHVYVPVQSSTTELLAMDEATGVALWRSALMFSGSGGSSPAVTSNGLYLSYPGFTYNLSPQTGAINWSNPILNTGSGGGGTTGALANGLFFSMTGSTGYYGVTNGYPSMGSTPNGKIVDTTSGAQVGTFSSDVPPAIGNGIGYFLQAPNLRAISIPSGAVVWSFVGDGTLSSPPVLVNNFLFIVSSSGNMYALDASNGSLLMQRNLGVSGDQYIYSGMTTPLGLSAGDGILVVPAGNTISAFMLSTSP